MSVFDQNSPKENSDELLYEIIKEELKPILEKYDERCGRTLSGSSVITLSDANRTKIIKEISKIVMQFVWKKLGMKMPDYTRRVLDDDFNILELKKENNKK